MTMAMGEQITFFWKGEMMIGRVKRFTSEKGCVPAHYVVTVGGRDYGVDQWIVEGQYGMAEWAKGA